MKAEVESSKNTRWVMRDVLTFVIFNLIIMILITVAKVVEDMLLAPQNTFFVGSWLFPLLATPFYLVMADRIGKRGVLSGSILIFGVLYTFMGGPYCAPVAIVGAVIGELVMWGKDSYHDIKRVIGVCTVQRSLHETVGNLLQCRRRYRDDRPIYRTPLDPSDDGFVCSGNDRWRPYWIKILEKTRP